MGRSTPVRQLKNVLFPAPFGPMIARISPRCNLEVDLVERRQAAEADRQHLGPQNGAPMPPPGASRGADIDRRICRSLTP